MTNLDSDNSDDWAKVYNQVMQRSLRFTPLSGRTLEKIVELLQSHNVTFLIGYERTRPSAVCSYFIDEKGQELNIYDLCVLPVDRHVGVSLLDQLLSLARSVDCKNVSTWIPSSSTTSLDVLGEYLFNPGRGMSLLRCFLAEAPADFNSEIINHTLEEDTSISTLPFHTPYQMQSITESLMSPWMHSYSVAGDDVSSGLEIFLSTKLHRQAWIFTSEDSDSPVSDEILSSTAAFLHDLGVRDILAEVESEDLWQKPYRNMGFDRISTRFELTFDLMY